MPSGCSPFSLDRLARTCLRFTAAWARSVERLQAAGGVVIGHVRALKKLVQPLYDHGFRPDSGTGSAADAFNDRGSK